jgi:tellurite resistance protein TerA
MQLQRGANLSVGGGRVTVTVALPPSAGDADVSAYLLLESGKVRDDSDMVFYNQPAGAGGAVRLEKDGRASRFAVDLDALPAAIHRIVFCVTADEAAAPRTLAAAVGASIAVTDAGGASVCSFAPELAGASEAAMTFGELYRRGGEWKFRAVGQGFNGGLGPLARSFGIDVADSPPAAPSPAPPPPPPAAPAAAPAAAAPAAPPSRVNLSKISLEKKGQSVSLEKRGASFGQILVNLNWTRGKRGFFGGGGIDLDLGCLVEMADGQKGVIQALGRAFGDYHGPPFLELDGDDRTGDVSGGENLRINGARWNELKRVAIFANIYEGVPNWQQTDGIVTVTIPDQPPVEVRMTEGRDDKRLCGIVLLENVGGTLKATRIVDYYRDQSELDRAFGWGLRWVAGRKD